MKDNAGLEQTNPPCRLSPASPAEPIHVPLPQPPPKPKSPARLCQKWDVKEGLRDKSAGTRTKHNMGLSQTGNRCQGILFSFASASDRCVFRRSSFATSLADRNSGCEAMVQSHRPDSPVVPPASRAAEWEQQWGLPRALGVSHQR